MNPNVVISDTSGLQTHGNELSAPVGSTSVADNVTFGRERLPERRNGFKDYSTNLPDFSPEQLLVGSNGTDKYLNLDSGLWYWDTTSSTWLRKRGVLGAKATQPTAVLYSAGHLYITAHHCVFDINLSTGVRSIIAGRFGVANSTDGTGDVARFSSPYGITTDGTNLYVVDSSNCTIRKLAPPLTAGAAVVTTICGLVTTPGTSDGAGTAGKFNNPTGICFDGTFLYVADYGNHSIRRVAAPFTAGAAVVSTIAGLSGTSGTTDGTGTAGKFANPIGICTDNTNLYVTDFSNHAIRRVAPPLTAGAGVVTTIAGVCGASSTNDGTGTAAKFNNPVGIVLAGTSLYIGDYGNHSIRKVAAPLTAGAGVVTTPAGVSGSSGTADGIGTAARFNNCGNLGWDGTDLYIADYTNSAIRKMYAATSYVTTISGVMSSTAPNTGAPFADGLVAGPT